MVEPYLRQGVLDHRHLDARAVDDPGDAGVVLCERRFLGKLVVRGPATKRFRDAVRGAAGVEPPRVPNTAVVEGARRALWLGPDEYLVVTPAGEEGVLAQALCGALAGQHASVVDVSEARTAIGLAGAHARDLLMKGSPLDVHPRAFGPGHCAQTLYAKANVLIHQTSDAPAYDLYVERSFADYLWAWLEDGAQEWGLAVVRG